MQSIENKRTRELTEEELTALRQQVSCFAAACACTRLMCPYGSAEILAANTYHNHRYLTSCGKHLSAANCWSVHWAAGQVDNYTIEGDLRRETSQNIQRLVQIQCHRGKRHQRVSAPMSLALYGGAGNMAELGMAAPQCWGAKCLCKS